MHTKTAQWILWSITMAVFAALTITGHFGALTVSMIVGSLVWYSVVPGEPSKGKY